MHAGPRLQQAGELAVPVGDVLAAGALRERADHVAQGAEALVDVHALRKGLPCGACLLCPLAACRGSLLVRGQLVAMRSSATGQAARKLAMSGTV